jgi:ring-1,2-phenylacetyl-CoA epoxidase subunit PaaE
MAIPSFHRLPIADVSTQTRDAITVAFAVPENLRDAYRFVQGQFLTLRATVEGEELRRSYSVCVGVSDYARSGTLRVGIKRVAGGRFSNWANDSLRAGHSIDVMSPDGRFFSVLNPTHQKRYLGIAGGSGITPMLSLIATSLETEAHSSFTLIYGNRTVDSIMFVEELEALKNRFMDRLQLIHVLSDEAQDIELLNGLLDQAKCSALIQALIPATTIDQAFICGPQIMMDSAEAALLEAGVAARNIAIERFGTPNPSGAPVRIAPIDESVPGAAVSITVDGKTRRIKVPFDGPAILDMGLAGGLNLPYACKGGVCCTCRAKVLSGEVRMDKNFTLEQWEMDKGFVLTCQSHPISATVALSYDER